MNQTTNGSTDTQSALPVAAPTHAHHAELWSELSRREAALVNAVAGGEDYEPLRRELVAFLRGEVLHHLQTEEMVLYNAARGAGAHALVDALELDHYSLVRLVDHIDQATTGLDAALSARALTVLFVLRIEKEEGVLVPTLTAAGVDVSTLIAGRPEMQGSDQH
ncbi:hemerythrin domain-containing protein [uncultured Cellulomonas sp.]|uniref:hemerythrin domain-containing protein n=1 Tax=uncultured Cellulomonas sp. TaxID=189682 RepID=UPI00260F9167|nr:hemerythrin domain-containing protein [uncultured Cellulomonas sp.]